MKIKAKKKKPPNSSAFPTSSCVCSSFLLSSELKLFFIFLPADAHHFACCAPAHSRLCFPINIPLAPVIPPGSALLVCSYSSVFDAPVFEGLCSFVHFLCTANIPLGAEIEPRSDADDFPALLALTDPPPGKSPWAAACCFH